MSLIEDQYSEYDNELSKLEKFTQKLADIPSQYSVKKRKSLALEDSVLDQIALLSLRSADCPDLVGVFQELGIELDSLERMFKNEEKQYTEKFCEIYKEAAQSIESLEKHEMKDSILKQQVVEVKERILGLKSEFLNRLKGDFIHNYYDIEQARKSLLEARETFRCGKQTV